MPGLNRLRFWGLLDFRCFLLAKRKHISPLKIAFVGAQHVVPRQIRYLTLIIILVEENLNHAKRDTVTGLRLSISRAQIKDKKGKSHSRSRRPVTDIGNACVFISIRDSNIINSKFCRLAEGFLIGQSSLFNLPSTIYHLPSSIFILPLPSSISNLKTLSVVTN
jgi:hypothetical protein